MFIPYLLYSIMCTIMRDRCYIVAFALQRSDCIVIKHIIIILPSISIIPRDLKKITLHAKKSGMAVSPAPGQSCHAVRLRYTIQHRTIVIFYSLIILSGPL